MHDAFSLDVFSPLVGDTFWIRAEGKRVEARLTEASRLGTQNGPRVPFSLVFVGPGRFVLPQQIYRVEHDKLGEMEIFLVPLGPEGEGMRYEAVFT
jgi:hypothetical protein